MWVRVDHFPELVSAGVLPRAESGSEPQRSALTQDRDRIARDLHDLVIQRLFATGMLLQTVHRSDGMPREARERVEQAVDDLDATIRDIRQTIVALHEPVDGSGTGVRGRIMQEAARWAVLLGFEPSVRLTGPIDTLVPSHIVDDVIGVLRESLANVVRHAHASQVHVSVTASTGVVNLCVTDDGIGVPRSVECPSGLMNLVSRARDLGGSCTITRVDHLGGTRVRWRVPVS